MAKTNVTFTKHIWQLPIPVFDPKNSTHLRLVELAKYAEKVAQEFEVKHDLHFSATRRHIRRRIEESSDGTSISEIVFELLS